MIALIEKTVIVVSLLAAFPLFFLDKEVLGLRRFAWLVAFCTGLTVQLFLDPTDELVDTLDKITMACISVTIVPHLVQFIQDNPWLGMSTMPPFFIVIYLSVQTTVNSEEYWRLRAFLHMAIFILPYLNHLPDDEPPKSTTTTTVGEEQEEPTTTSKSSKKTNKEKK
jgi:hypothetical protein